MPPSKKKTTKKKKARSSRAAWSEGERRVDRMAAKAGAKPIRDIKDLAFLTPEDADDLLSAIREMRELEHRGAIARIDQQAAMEKTKRKRAPKRA